MADAQTLYTKEGLALVVESVYTVQTQKFKCDITKPLIEAIELKLSNMRIHEFLRPIGQKIKFLLLEKKILHYNY